MKIVVNTQGTSAPKKTKPRKSFQRSSGRGFKKNPQVSAAEIEREAREMEHATNKPDLPEEPIGEVSGESFDFIPPAEETPNVGDTVDAASGEGVSAESYPPVQVFPGDEVPPKPEETPWSSEDITGQTENLQGFGHDGDGVEEDEVATTQRHLKLGRKERSAKVKNPSKKGKPNQSRADKVLSEDFNDAADNVWIEEPTKPVGKGGLSAVISIAEVLVAGAIFAVLGNQVGTILLNNIVTKAMGG